jgi:prolipoprotein diacylglyceryltransferase
VELRKLGLSKRKIGWFAFGLILVVFIGERTLWVSRYWPYYRDRSWAEILSFWQGGMDLPKFWTQPKVIKRIG